MKRIGIICKRGKKEPKEILVEILPYLREKGHTVILDEFAARELGVEGHPLPDIPGLVDAVMVLGGDGTMLSVARLVAGNDIPIMGINLGSLGFITEVSREEIKEAVDKMIGGECSVEERLMLDVSIYREGRRTGEYSVLNDIVINKGALARIIDLEMFIEHKYVTTYKADGLIVATPTGSTAYSLSAGGPIVYPTLGVMLITPICPHALANRPIVIGKRSLVEIVLLSESEDVYLTLDGQVGVSLRRGDRIEIQKSEHTAKLLIPCDKDYFNILRTKLKWGER